MLEHRKAYYPWIRQVVTLASTSLTALVALQKYYISDKPVGLLLLKLCWVALALSIVLGVVGLYSESHTPLRAANILIEHRRKYGDQAAAEYVAQEKGTAPKKIFLIAQRYTGWCYGFSLLCLATFAVLNI